MNVFQAIADPVRRGILETLNIAPLSAGEIASRYAISRPAVSRHLRVLRDAGLVSTEVVGRHQIYHLERPPLRELDAWLEQYRDHWPARFDALETEVYRTRNHRRLRSNLSDQRKEKTA